LIKVIHARAAMLVLIFGLHTWAQPISLPDAATRFTVAAESPLPGVIAGVPSVLTLPDGRLRVFFCSGPEGLRSATSIDDGETFSLDVGSRIRGACDGSLIALRDGRYRFLTSENTSVTFGHAQVISFITIDGLTFTRESGVRFTGSPSDAGFTGVPQALALPDGRHRLYYVGDPLDPSPSGNGIRTAISTDEGWSWTPEITTNLLPRSHVDPEVRLTAAGRFRMFVRVPGHPGGALPSDNAGIWWADSDDGLTFTLIGRVVRDPEDLLDAADPAVVGLTTGRVLMFLGSKSGELRVATAIAQSRRRAVRAP
jgi:hypothetical protein